MFQFMKYYRLLVFCAAITIGCFYACNSPFAPKPRGYFDIPLPNHQYQLFDQPGYPYTFEYPVYANVVKDTTFFEDKAENDWWINVDFPEFNSRFYISYKSVKTNSFDKMISDAFNLTYKHSTKASSIDDSVFRTPNNISGVLFKVGGNAATAHQFFLTDTINHFLRGALYFDAPPNEDSLQPVTDFIKEDMYHLINSFKWRN
jgi:gliding motility-associated lipoprotein GldD